MKKAIIMIMAVLMMIGLCSCGGSIDIHDTTTITSEGIMKDAETGKVVGIWNETYTLD